MSSTFRFNFVAAVVLSCFAACSSGGGSSSSSSAAGGTGGTASSTQSDYFPTSFAVASPLDRSVSGAALMKALATGSVPAYSREFEADTDGINDVLNGTSLSACSFDASLFLSRSGNAGCYGPSVGFEGHPDAGSGSSAGELPPGDLGIWSEEETDGSGEACSAAQLNARLDGMSDQMNAGLTAAAAVVCVINNNSGTLSMPADSTTTLTSEMNADLGEASLTFNEVTLAHSDDTGRDAYTYALDFNYTDADGESHAVAVTLQHVEGCDDGGYEGVLSYSVDDEEDLAFGNCPASGPGVPVTRAGSLAYRKYSDYAMATDSRTAVFCGNGAADTFDGDGLVDFSAKYDASTNPDGWGGDANRFITNFNPTTLSGQYAYAWQAGALDNYTRAFNIYLERDNDTDLLSGSAFFGYGSDVGDSDGAIDGFICNWAGPGGAINSGTAQAGTVTLAEKAQSQTIVESSAGGVFTASASEITYAPTNDCDYDGTGSFRYDRDADGDLSDESASTAVANDLADFSEIGDQGILLPRLPSGFSTAACTSETLYTATGEYHDGTYWDAVLRFDDAQDIDSDADGAVVPNATIPVKSDPVGSGIVDANGYQMNFIHTLYLWDDDLYLGSLFTNKNNYAGDPSNPALQYMANTSYEIGSVGVLTGASSLTDGGETLDRHLFDHLNADGTTSTTTELHQPHGIWIDKTLDILYVANSFSGKILVFDGASSLDGNTAPSRVIEHPELGSPIHVFVDEANDRLFVASVAVSTGSPPPPPSSVKYHSAGGVAEPSDPGTCNAGPPAVVIYNGASSLNGTVEPDVRIVGDNTRLCEGNNQTTHNVWYDEDLGMIFASHHTNELLMYAASEGATGENEVDLQPSTPTDYDVVPRRFLEINEDADGADLYYWSVYGFYYLAEKDRLYVSGGYSSGATDEHGSVPDVGVPPNEIKVYDGVGLSHFNGQMTPTRVIHWDGGDVYYPSQALWVKEN